MRSTLFGLGLILTFVLTGCLQDGSSPFIADTNEPPADWRNHVVAWGQVDGVGDLDAVLVVNQEVRLVRRTDRGWTQSRAPIPPLEVDVVVKPIDLDGDGRDEILVDETRPWTYPVSAWVLALEDGQLVDRVRGAAPWSYMLPTDLDGDGRLEIVGAEAGGCCSRAAAYALYSDLDGAYHYEGLEPELLMPAMTNAFDAGIDPPAGYIEAVSDLVYYDVELDYAPRLAEYLADYAGRAANEYERDVAIVLALQGPDETRAKAFARHALREWQSSAAAVFLLRNLEDGDAEPVLYEAVRAELDDPTSDLHLTLELVRAADYPEHFVAALREELTPLGRAQLFRVIAVTGPQPQEELTDFAMQTEDPALAEIARRALLSTMWSSDTPATPELIALWQAESPDRRAETAWRLPASASPALYEAYSQEADNRRRTQLASFSFQHLRPRQQNHLLARVHAVQDEDEARMLHQIVANGVDDPEMLLDLAASTDYVQPYFQRLAQMDQQVVPRPEIVSRVNTAIDRDAPDASSLVWLLRSIEYEGKEERLAEIAAAHSNSDVRVTAIHNMDPDVYFDDLVALADAEDPHVRRAALGELGNGPHDASLAFQRSLARGDDVLHMLSQSEFVWTAALEDVVLARWDPSEESFCESLSEVAWPLVERGLLSPREAIEDAEDHCDTAGVREVWNSWQYRRYGLEPLTEAEAAFIDALETHPLRQVRGLGNISRQAHQ